MSGQTSFLIPSAVARDHEILRSAEDEVIGSGL
jgi:hypothetical protein